jgi:hypothetical protein
VTAERRNPPMPATQMRERAAGPECLRCDPTWRQFVACTADVDRLREERDDWRTAAHGAEGDLGALRQLLSEQGDKLAELRATPMSECPIHPTTEVLQAFATLRRHLPANLRQAEAELEAAWANRGPLPIDWPPRLRAAAEVAESGAMSTLLANAAMYLPYLHAKEVEAIGRALLGEDGGRHR